MREKVGTGHADWTAFLQAVHDVGPDHIRDGVDTWKKEQEVQEALRKRIQQLEKLMASPTAPLRHQMMSLGIRNQTLTPMQQPQQPTPNSVNLNPFTSPTGGRGNLFQTAQIKPASQNSNPRPPATQADRATLLICIQKYPHHPEADRPTRPNRLTGQGHMGQMHLSQSQPPTP